MAKLDHCNGTCNQSTESVLKQLKEILDDTDIIYSWHKAVMFIREELKKQ
jgi:hypothetical protein